MGSFRRLQGNVTCHPPSEFVRFCEVNPRAVKLTGTGKECGMRVASSGAGLGRLLYQRSQGVINVLAEAKLKIYCISVLRLASSEGVQSWLFNPPLWVHLRSFRAWGYILFPL